MQRFLKHIIPGGVHRVGYGGIFHGKGRIERLDRCRLQMIEYNEENNIVFHPAGEPLEVVEQTSTRERKSNDVQPELVVEKNYPKCPRCNTPQMQPGPFIDGRSTRGMIAMTQSVIARYAMTWTTLDDWSKFFAKNINTGAPIQQYLFDSLRAFVPSNLYDDLFCRTASCSFSAAWAHQWSKAGVMVSDTSGAASCLQAQFTIDVQLPLPYT